METSEKKIPDYIYEDLLFKRRLERSLNDELERLSNLLVGQVRLLKEREALMSKIHAAVEKRWEEEEPSEVIDRTEHTEEEESPDGQTWRTSKMRRTDARRGRKRGNLTGK
jgi:hypothetical protein